MTDVGGIYENGSLISTPRDFLIEVRRGNVPGFDWIHKFGRNDAILE